MRPFLKLPNLQWALSVSLPVPFRAIYLSLLLISILLILRPATSQANICLDLLSSTHPGKQDVFSTDLPPSKINSSEAIQGQINVQRIKGNSKGILGSFPRPTPENIEYAALLGVEQWYSMIATVESFEEAKKILSSPFLNENGSVVFPLFVITGKPYDRIRDMFYETEGPNEDTPRLSKIKASRQQQLFESMMKAPDKKIDAENASDPTITSIFLWDGQNYLEPQEGDGWRYVTQEEATRFLFSESRLENWKKSDVDTVAFIQDVWVNTSHAGEIDMGSILHGMKFTNEEMNLFSRANDEKFANSEEGQLFLNSELYQKMKLNKKATKILKDTLKLVKTASKGGVFSQIRFNVSPLAVIQQNRETIRKGQENGSWISSDEKAEEYLSNIEQGIKEGTMYTVGLFDANGKMLVSSFGPITKNNVTSDTIGYASNIINPTTGAPVKLARIDLGKILSLARMMFFYDIAGYDHFNAGMVSRFTAGMGGRYIPKEEAIEHMLETERKNINPKELPWDTIITPKQMLNWTKKPQ